MTLNNWIKELTEMKAIVPDTANITKIQYVISFDLNNTEEGHEIILTGVTQFKKLVRNARI